NRQYFTFYTLLQNLAYNILSPYSTLFRSSTAPSVSVPRLPSASLASSLSPSSTSNSPFSRPPSTAGSLTVGTPSSPSSGTSPDISEEHTSALQSRDNLLCRLLLEKKHSYL